LYEIELKGGDFKYEYEELVKVFLRPSEYRLSVVPGVSGDKKTALRELYLSLSNRTGKRPEWGILTGVRPVKLTAELYEKFGDFEKVKEVLEGEYLLEAEKARLLLSIYKYQREILKNPDDKHAGIYIGIPFCPTRCLYCSFTSNPIKGARINEYMEALYKEIKSVGIWMKETGIKPETVYIGGGTPAVLSADLLETLFTQISDNFDLSDLAEYTFEAGRPDAIDEEKLKIIEGAGIGRISINPQSMNQATLDRIGRSHGTDDVIKAFTAAGGRNIKVINTDIIAGLPGESAEDFTETVNKVLSLSPENITVHTLAVKRASRLIETDRDYHYDSGDVVRDMLDSCRDILKHAGYIPYYLYRQKNMAGNLENTGWCRPKTAGIYNIRIMEEKQTIAALGAGGITKVYYPAENRLERVPNVSDYEHYIRRVDEMIERKKENLFNRR